MAGDSTYAMTPNVRVGLGIASFMGVLSFLGSMILLLYSVFRVIFREGFDPQPVTIMFIYWIVTDLIQSLATTANLRWALQGRINSGAYCRTQSVFEQIGDSGAAICVIVISILVLIRNIRPALLTHKPHRTSIILVLAISFILLMIILVPATVLKHYYGDTGTWCWIVDRHGNTYRLRIGTEYALMWAALGVETVVYVGLLVHAWLFPSVHNRYGFRSALGMLWYAIAYAVEIIPMSIVRIRQFQHDDIAHGWDAFALIFFGAAGFVNALLFFSTGRDFGFSGGTRRRQVARTEIAEEILEDAEFGDVAMKTNVPPRVDFNPVDPLGRGFASLALPPRDVL